MLLKISTLKTENKDSTEKFLAEVQRKTEDIEALQKENEKHEQQEDMLEKQVNQIHIILQEKEKLILQYKDSTKKLEVQISEVLIPIGINNSLELSLFEFLVSLFSFYATAESGTADCS